MIDDQDPYDQTLAGCEAIAQAVLQTRAAVQDFETSAQEAMANARAMYAETVSQFSGGPAMSSPEDAIHSAMQAEKDLIKTMAQALEKAQSEAQRSMAAAMAAVGGSAGASSYGEQHSGNPEQATLQAIQAMAHAHSSE